MGKATKKRQFTLFHSTILSTNLNDMLQSAHAHRPKTFLTLFSTPIMLSCDMRWKWQTYTPTRTQVFNFTTKTAIVSSSFSLSNVSQGGNIFRIIFSLFISSHLQIHFKRLDIISEDPLLSPPPTPPTFSDMRLHISLSTAEPNPQLI